MIDSNLTFLLNIIYPNYQYTWNTYTNNTINWNNHIINYVKDHILN